MTDPTYGSSNTPSSRPPEPPYRSNATQPLNGGQQSYGAPDTSGIDRAGEVPATGQYAPIGSDYPTESFGNARMGDTATMPNAGASGNTGRHSAVAQHTYQAPAPQPAKQKSGAGKSFIFGFLGALVACALAFGGFAIWQGTQNPSSAAAVLGTSDPSVINAVDEGQTIAEAVAAKALPSVVAVYNYQQQSSSGYGYGFGYGYGNSSDSSSSEPVAMGMGSGVVISDDGYIITNYHVVEGADKLTVTVDGVERDAELVGSDSSSDIAVVKVADTEGLVAADIGDSDSLKIGEWVMTVGAPLGLEQSVATGVVSATNRSTIMDLNSSSDEYSYYYGYGYGSYTPQYAYYPNMIQTDALINPGNSGGALVDADGKLVGINSMLSSYSGDYAGVGFAIPINYAIGLAEDIIAGNEPSHAALGVSISQVNSQTAQRYSLSATSGAYIAGIYEGSGAADSDLQVGDIITAINGKAVTSTTDVTLDVRGYNVGETVTVTVNRNGETLDIPVVLMSDQLLDSSSNDSTQQQQQQSPYDNGGGTEDEYSMEDLERFLRMLGM
ncbi:MAG: trypsin-like peptidase domain-containing protein [Eggerthellaceae bacterium]|nr:trypsin-like peptidase domain-containing protein [Eggerthellaceae bacterium]